jgi:hypothetical protein
MLVFPCLIPTIVRPAWRAPALPQPPHGNGERDVMKSYRIIREIQADHDAFVFEFDGQSEEELFQDFPWLRNIGRFAFAHRRQSSQVGGEE